MIAFCTALVLAAPQQPAAAADDLVVASGFTAPLPAEALELGDGGISSEQRMVAPFDHDEASWTTPGGVLVRVSTAGAKLDFPAGTELLVDNRCRVHLRSGEATLPALHGLDLVLGDGARLSLKPGLESRAAPFRSVVVEDGEQAVAIWQAAREVRRRRPGARSARSGYEVRVLGDGQVLYHTTERGPLLFCDRVLCPADARGRFPERRVVVRGDLLADSLRRLPGAMPEKSLDYPEGPRAARYLAQFAGTLFAPGVQRAPDGVLEPKIVPLAGGMRLEMLERSRDVIALTLTAPRSVNPACEWLVGRTATLHLVRKDAGEEGRPRYFQRGIPVAAD